MFSLKSRKKIAGVIALCAVCGLIAGCDGDRHHRPPHDDHRGDRYSRKHHDNRPHPGNNSHHHGSRRHAALAGAYTALALNDTVMPKGTEISLNVEQGADEILCLVDPTGKKYPIQFDAETGAGNVAGGSLSLREDGHFVYKDAQGGLWLVMRQ